MKHQNKLKILHFAIDFCVTGLTLFFFESCVVMPNRYRAFSLVELLVVLSLLSLLLGFLLPAVGKARESARRVTCASHLAQIGKCLEIYSLSWKGAYYPPALGFGTPEPDRWYHHVRGLEASMLTSLRCPTADLQRAEHTYLLNGYLTDLRARTHSRFRRGQSICDTILVGEKRDGVPQHYYGYHMRYATDPLKHGAGTNYLFLDMHVEFRQPWLPLPGARDIWDVAY